MQQVLIYCASNAYDGETAVHDQGSICGWARTGSVSPESQAVQQPVFD